MSKSTVIRCKLPLPSALEGYFNTGDFLDSYSVASDMAPRPAANIITSFPEWARMLLVVRHAMTAPFGLSNTGPEAEDKVGIFPVESETDDELIAGFDDKHLNFRVAVISRQNRVYLATWVHPHNLGGKLYLSMIMPFHIVIVRNALARVSRSSSQ